MMRPTPWLLVMLALGLAACGDAEPPEPAADPDQPVQAPARHEPTGPPPDPAACERLSRRLPGRGVDEAEALAREARCALRVVERDGRSLPVTEDFSESRINVRVRDGVVTEVAGLF
jgi:hypothetical protein